MAAERPLVSFAAAGFRYPGATADQWAVQDLSLALYPGQSVCLVGGNGSGKSTLAKLACGLLAPDAGMVLVDGRDSRDEDAAATIHACCGYVFQNPDDQLVEAIVEDEVAFGPANRGLPRDQIAERVRDSLAAVGLAGSEKHPTAALSGGQKQRLAIAGTLALHPRLLVLDEAASMLDPQGRRSLSALLAHLRAQGIATLSVTHFMDEALAADRVIALEAGRIAFTGSPEHLFDDTALLARLGLAEPAVVAVRRALAEQGHTLPFCRTNGQLAQAAAARRSSEGIPAAAAPAGQASAPTAATAGAHAASVPAAATPDAGAADAGAAGTEKPENRPLLTFDQVTFAYPAADRPAVRDLSLALYPGTLVGIAGATGSGKSTVLKLMAGLLEPDAGRIGHGSVADAVSAPAPAPTRRRFVRRGTDAVALPVGLVFQYPERQLFAPTVREDAAFGPRNRGRNRQQAAADAEAALTAAGVDRALWERNPFSLSGGEQRRVALAGVLALQAPLLAADEPTAGQDPAHAAQLAGLLESLRAQGRTVVAATHDMELLLRCDTVLIMAGGTVVRAGAPQGVLADPAALEALGLAAPDMLDLRARLIAVGFTLPENAQTPAALAGALEGQLV